MLAYPLLALAALVSTVAALPAPPRFKLGVPACPVTSLPVDIPTNQTAISLPAGQAVKFVMLGRGIQNYTCAAATSKFVSVGAVADLHDASCIIAGGVPPAKLSADALKLARFPAPTSIGRFALPPSTGKHVFIKNPAPGGTGLTPVFSFQDTLKDPNAFIASKKLGNTPAPNTAADVDWLQLAAIDGAIGGTLAKTVFRIYTAGGQPPATCDPANTAVLSVQYASMYYFLA